MAKIYQGRRCREKSAKGKGAGGEVWGNQGRSLFSQQRTCFITPVTGCGYMCDLMSARKAHQRLRAQGSTRGWSQTHIASVWYGAKIQAPRRKKVLSINHDICAKILGTVRQPYQLDQRRPSQNPCSQMSVKGQSCKRAIARLKSQVCQVNCFVCSILGQKPLLPLVSPTVLPNRHPPPRAGHIHAAEPCLCTSCSLCLPHSKALAWPWSDQILSILLTKDTFPFPVECPSSYPIIHFHFSTSITPKRASVFISYLFIGTPSTGIKFPKGRKMYVLLIMSSPGSNAELAVSRCSFNKYLSHGYR